jgi:RHS repeat-associated protein
MKGSWRAYPPAQSGGSSTTSTFTYDSRGRRTSATDQNGKTTSYAYDTADRLTTVTDAASNVTTYSYDTENNLLVITDANNHTTNFTYDAFGRVTQTTFPSSFYESYAYDAIGNLTSKTDRKGQTIQYVYDALNRLTQKSYPDSTSAAYTYDLASRIQQVNDPTGTYAFAYDNMGRLIGTTTNYSFLSGTTFTNAYTYDLNSNRTGYTAPDGSTNTYTYDTLNRLTTLANSWAGSFSFTYDTLSRRTQMTRPNGVNTNYTYDSLSRLLSVLHQNGASTIDGASYTLDSAGNRTSKTDQLSSVTSNYTYDSIYELTQVTQAANTTESYTYDPVGNRLSSPTAATSNYNASNQLTSNSSATYTYDANGNTTGKTDLTGATTFSWDFKNQLTGIMLPGTGGTVNFKYDPFGRRIEKVSPSATRIFAYDSDGLIETVDSSGAVMGQYTLALDIDEPLAERRSSVNSYYEADGLGSISSLTSVSGSVANTYTYDSYGTLTNSTGTLRNPLSYTAREFDNETGIYYYRARYYDQTTGRFLSEDPLGFNADVNSYRYALGSPLMYTDATGLTVTCIYNQTTGRLRCTDDANGQTVVNTSGYSGGAEGKCPCVNDPFSQGVKGGPIPTGYWSIGPGYTWKNRGPGKPDLFDTMRLTPSLGSSADAFRRSPGFLIHGGFANGDTTASNGCIIIDRASRHEIVERGGGMLHVISGLAPFFPPSYGLLPPAPWSKHF